ncbi:peptidoglycan DD-metalloendopeptidase family protein [Aeromicrobium tamlense]|uniref:Murein DD-endopeptidase MepM/ murein hydrolase activator NlpD n=1 Tax=Aeromicrobium tamlense TaxID=375541 RepID=A0A8I0FVI6_9ACTN|nr:peptidoglycan DD-metalloendopeptidase family protein [Aeromicrobium tamlense]MBD1270516.1 peptidoglycan DD-metalloendopeptidase family protein [Aeromicrobium tamlense]MBD1271352.1 peptidoglycan DD-metalloendopeptidase family protein [Aeromicrobium tamlense]NYI37903.1 murein DD-endopeptidase MepM/ murein hydrolase activator NlpD [Aeromicrobium tamlense]
MRWTRVFAGVTVLVAGLAFPTAAHAVDPTTPPSTGAPSATSSAPSLDVPDVPDPLAIAPSAITELTTLALRYEANLSVAEDRRKEAAERTRDADRQRRVARAYVAQVVDYAMSPSGDPFARKLTALAAAENPEDLITGIFSTEQVTEAQEGHLGDAKRAFEAAQKLQRRADRATAIAEKAEKAAARQLAQVGKLAEQLGLGASSTPEGLPQTRAEQEAWNDRVATAWTSYRKRLARLGVKAPSAARLKATKGVGTATVGSRTVQVLPAQTIRMIDALVGRIGQDYSARNASPAWSCGGVVNVKNGYDLRGTPAQLYARTVKVPTDEILRGDLVFSANKKSGIHHVGVYVGDGLMIDAPATRAQVGVSEVPAKPYAVTRPSLGSGRNTPPNGSADSPTTVCNATRPVAATRQGWTFPLKQGSYSISAGFGMGGSMWQSTHTGQDLAAPTGTPIYASRGGTVSLQEVGWAGTLITISHPDGTAERYAHSSKVLVEDGQTVSSGDEIALVGSRGNSTGPHLHFEIQVDGQFIDPMPVLVQFLTNNGAGKGWGGYSNGQVPRGVLCAVGDTMLRCDVAKRAKRLAADYAREFRGERLDFATGYRDIVGQIQRGPEGTLVDIPGTSPFGWGTRFELGDLSKAQSAWVAKRAAKLGLKGEGNGTWSLPTA